jgi:hypothetical protein
MTVFSLHYTGELEHCCINGDNSFYQHAIVCYNKPNHPRNFNITFHQTDRAWPSPETENYKSLNVFVSGVPCLFAVWWISFRQHNYQHGSSGIQIWTHCLTSERSCVLQGNAGIGLTQAWYWTKIPQKTHDLYHRDMSALSQVAYLMSREN